MTAGIAVIPPIPDEAGQNGVRNKLAKYHTTRGQGI
jgi:hypothetical protein